MTAPQYGGLVQNGITPTKVMVVDAFIAPVGTLYNANTGVNGGWTPLGTIQPGSAKNSFEKKIYDFVAGLPETPQDSFVTGLDGKIQMNLVEPTYKAFEIANGGDPGVALFNAVPVSTTVQSQINPPPAPTVTTATTGGTVAAGTYLAAVTYVNASGQTTISQEVPITTTGATSTITVNGGTLPAGVTQVNVYLTAVGGGTGTEKLQGNYTTGNNLVITAYSGAGAAIPGANTSGPASTSEIINVASAAGFQVNYPVQTVTVNGTEYSWSQAVTTSGQNNVTVFPKFSGIPSNGANFKMVDGFEEPIGTATIQYYALRTIALAQDGSQVVTWSPKVRFNGLKDEAPQGKEFFIPLEAMLYGFYDSSYNGPILGKKFVLSSRMALPYSS